MKGKSKVTSVRIYVIACIYVEVSQQESQTFFTS